MNVEKGSRTEAVPFSLSEKVCFISCPEEVVATVVLTVVV